jgi:hypothetical protein
MAESGRSRAWGLLAATSALTLLTGCGLFGHDDTASAAPLPAAAPDASESLEPIPEESVSEEPSPTPSRTSVKPKVKSAEPTQPAFWSQLPACAHRDATKSASKAKVKAALKTSSARIYWHTEAPNLKLNYPLVKAVAWQESGWQSNIHNCDGGTGVMQVMPSTVDMINDRFGLAYDASKLQDNTDVGANYLAWLVNWVEYNYFKGTGYSLSTSKCKSHTSWCLLNVVISGYQAGAGGIEAAAASKKLPNPEYVAAVRSLMTRCQCDQY